MDFYIYLCFSALWLLIGLLVGYKWHEWEASHVEHSEVTYTSGAAYDACLDDEPTTDHDAEVARKLLNW